jgi:hypothetical protein
MSTYNKSNTRLSGFDNAVHPPGHLRFTLALLFFSISCSVGLASHDGREMVYNWTSVGGTHSNITRLNAPVDMNDCQITPSHELDWVPCFDNFTCARLKVPLDHEDTSRGAAAIAFVKFAAPNATNNTQNVLINPGMLSIRQAMVSAQFA